jgi:hypothetical protein
MQKGFPMETTNATSPSPERNAKRSERKGKGPDTVTSLLADLRKAAERGDASRGKKIRRKLRKLGHYGGLRERESSDVRVTGKRVKKAKANATKPNATKRTRKVVTPAPAAQTIDSAPPTHPIDQMAETDA